MYKTNSFSLKQDTKATCIRHSIAYILLEPTMTLKYVEISPLPPNNILELPVAPKYVENLPMTPNMCGVLISIGKQNLLIWLFVLYYFYILHNWLKHLDKKKCYRCTCVWLRINYSVIQCQGWIIKYIA